MALPNAYLSLFHRHLPEKSIPYCIRLWEESPFLFKVKAPRSSKLGDFRYSKGQELQTITLNADLNPYQFLLTLIHEIAHLRAFTRYGVKHEPHGKEWKSLFNQLIEPLLDESIFPIDLLVPLRIHMKNPSASSAKDLFLMKEMSKYDTTNQANTFSFLADLGPETHFELAGRRFTKKESRRTRVLCVEMESGKKYLVSRLAKVIPLP
ncbi:MAG: hypothetical protein RL407_1914 [Bacteroidota bacterium]|jgi:hypothetical protein